MWMLGIKIQQKPAKMRLLGVKAQQKSAKM